ncbi:MAG: PD-(D/E)XK nuclease family protein [Synergistaceae bacterium]|jgi:RecB family exonuclease|nr:PD-(D/E)XK nuclease family protein [Synergistaceae bacterium]
MLPSLSNSDALLDVLRGDGFFGEKPSIWSWSEMYANLLPRAEQRRQIDPPDHRLILRHILDKNLGELDERGLMTPGGVRRRGFIDVLSASVRELLLEGVPPDMLLLGAADLGSTGNKNAASLRDLLYRLYSDYLIYLEENGLADNSQIPALIADYLSDSPRKTHEKPGNQAAVLYWVGFLSLTGSQLRLVKILRERGKRMVFFIPETGLENFRDLAEQLDMPKEPLDGGFGRRPAVPLIASDIYEQYEGTAREIERASRGLGPLSGALGRGSSPQYLDIGILAPRERLPLLASALARRGIPYQSRSETTVSETRLLETARMAWEAYSLGWPARRTLNILKSSFGDSLFGNGQGSNASLPPDGLEAWRIALADSVEPLALLENLNSFCEYINAPPGRGPAELLRALLGVCGDEWERRLSREVGGDASMDFALRQLSSSRLEIEQKLDMMEKLTPPTGPAIESRFRGEDAIGFLSDWAREAATALPLPLRGAVALYDSPPPVLVSHKLWIMTDVDPTRFPGPSSDQPLLDGALRESVNNSEIVHLPTIHEKREQREALFRRLIAIGEDSTLAVRSARDSRGREQGDSPFLASLLSDPDSGWVRRETIFCAFDPSSEGDQIRRGVFPRVGRARDFAAFPGKFRVAPSSIDEFISCPFSYWCGHIARFEPPRPARAEAGALDRMLQGSVVHDIWRIVWNVYLERGETPLSTTLFMSWDEALSILGAKYPELGDPRARAALTSLKGAMSRVALLQDDVEARADAAGFVRERTEFEYELPVFELENVMFRGKADRIDFWSDLGIVAIDYKLGNSARYRDSLQLASYAAILEAFGTRVAGFGYVGHRDGGIRGSWSAGAADIYKGGSKTRDAGLDEKISDALEAMKRIDSIIGEGNFTANYGSVDCKFCQWGTICRRAEMYGAAVAADFDDEEENNVLW